MDIVDFCLWLGMVSIRVFFLRLFPQKAAVASTYLEQLKEPTTKYRHVWRIFHWRQPPSPHRHRVAHLHKLPKVDTFVCATRDVDCLARLVPCKIYHKRCWMDIGDLDWICT